ncbi:hypothetical protein LOTGIDRAFT_163168 [Lottia gigantea]|uniref:Uncharacterized protein n=1 Tax=Lottia gigantea TaxID=225164 RepID=V3ZKF4_LOTGI|nr:hypothetical protein LOTGIDRAFT_163168 [Lottia gigantea]ESO91808.1 hypothetical protein LOTGIDRAFT_163168 [Lottia gigantea]
MELESIQQYMIDKQNELKEKLKQFNKCRQTWSRIDSVFKTLSTVLTVGITVATAVTGFTSKKKAYYKKKTEMLNTYLNKLFIFFERSREDKNIIIEELEEFNEILDKFDVEISSIKVKNSCLKNMNKIGILDDEKFISNELFSNVIKLITDEFLTFKGQIELDGEIIQDGGHKQYMQFVGFNAKTFRNFFATVDVNSDASDWYFTGKMILRKNNFKEIKRSKKGSGVTLLKKINEYSGINCFIPSDRYCVNRVLNEDYKREFQDFINSFSKPSRKGVMTTARICEFNKKFNTNFQIYMPKHRHFQPKKVSEELDWVFYLHKSHFCLIRRNNKTLGISEIEDNYDENVWSTCRDDNAITQVSPLKLNVFPTIHDDCLYAWDCETYNENKAIPYSCTLINLEKLRKMLDRINNLFPDLKPTDPIPEEFYNKLMNIVEIFVGTDCIDQMLQRLGKIDQKRITLIAHYGSGFDNWIMIKNEKN